MYMSKQRKQLCNWKLVKIPGLLEYQSVYNCCYLLLCAAICCYLLLFAAVCFYLLLFAAICGFLLVFVAICCYLLLFAAVWCYYLLFVAVCWCLLLFAAKDGQVRPQSGNFSCNLLLFAAVCSKKCPSKAPKWPSGDPKCSKMVQKSTKIGSWGSLGTPRANWILIFNPRVRF